MDPKVHILILNWNGRDYLSKCLEFVKALDYSNYIITIIDNNSDDDSISTLDKSDINLITHSKNYKYWFLIQTYLNLQ